MFKNRLIWSVLIAMSIISNIIGNVYAEKMLKVVTSTEFLADWTRQIGKDLVDVKSVHDGRVDMHFYTPRPGHILMCSEADVFITPGLGMDEFMQPLLDASRNPKLKYRSSGYVDASFGVEVLQKITRRVDMSMGHIHPFGNPHYLYDLKNVGIALANIAVGLSRNDPQNADTFSRNKDEYWQEVQTVFRTLKTLMEPYKGTKVIPYHMSWEYFTREFGLEIVEYFETKPGIPPSPKHMKDLIQTMKKHNVKIIIKEPYYPKRPVKKVAKQTEAIVLELVHYPGGRPEAPTYLENLKANVNDLLEALKSLE